MDVSLVYHSTLEPGLHAFLAAFFVFSFLFPVKSVCEQLFPAYLYIPVDFRSKVWQNRRREGKTVAPSLPVKAGGKRLAARRQPVH